MSRSRILSWAVAVGALTVMVLTSAYAGEGGQRSSQRPGLEALFERLDTDRDGSLTQAEVPAEKWEKLSKADADGNGGVTLAELQALHAGGGGGGGTRPEPGQLFERHDGNRDGKLTQDEVPAPLWEKLSKADADADGGVTLAEFRTARQAAGGAAPDPQAMFQRKDANGDGRLTEDEVGQAWQWLSRADTNGDGGVTLDEFQAAQAARPAAGQTLREKFAKLDQNQDGAVDATEAPEALWAKLQAADANGDGQVTLAELDTFRPAPPAGGAK